MNESQLNKFLRENSIYSILRLINFVFYFYLRFQSYCMFSEVETNAEDEDMIMNIIILYGINIHINYYLRFSIGDNTKYAYAMTFINDCIPSFDFLGSTLIDYMMEKDGTQLRPDVYVKNLMILISYPHMFSYSLDDLTCTLGLNNSNPDDVGLVPTLSDGHIRILRKIPHLHGI